MRTTKILSNILAMKWVRVVGGEFEAAGLIIDVRPTTRVARCSGCGRRVHRVYDHRRGRRWRHLDLAGMQVELRYDLRRVNCSRCGVRTEMIPWAAPDSKFTSAFEEQVGYLAQRADKTTVVELMRIAWRTVGSIIARVVERHGTSDRLEGLRYIGIDELSYRRHHEYITIVTNHETGKVVWAHKGKSAATLDIFFAELGIERCQRLHVATIDMSQAYIQSVKSNAPQASIVFDRFHVQRLVQDALDEVRRSIVRKQAGSESAKAIKKSRFVLLKNPENLSASERGKLAQVQATNKPLYRAYLLKESLASILDRGQYYVARRELLAWLQWAARSKLEPFIKAARTIRKHMEGILAYISTGMSNARSEGLNGKARTITRRSYGFHSAANLIALLFLCCAVPRLSPVLTLPKSHPLTC